MKYHLSFSFMLFTALSVGSCKSGNGAADTSDSTTTTAVADNIPAATSGEAALSGTITEVADAGYPLFIVTVQPTGEAKPVDFTVSGEPVEGTFFTGNIEGINDRNITALKGKTVDMRYKTIQKMAIMDIQANGKTLLDGHIPQKHAEWQKIVGTLDGAGSDSGDLPNNISVTDKEGKKVDFQFFVFEKIRNVNKKEVAVYYEPREETVITFMRVAS